MAKLRAFVPRMTVRRAVASVLPACALAAATELAACKKPEGDRIIVLAVMAFDAAVDMPIALAVTAFDAGTDAQPGVNPEKDASATMLPPASRTPPHVLVLAMMAFDSGIDPVRRHR